VNNAILMGVIKLDYNKSIGKRLADFSNAKIYNNKNGIIGQCVWYVRCRALEKCNTNTDITGNANTWFSSARSKKLAVSQIPISNSIACFNCGKFGHVIFVEQVVNNTVFYTEANSNSDNRLSADDGILKKQDIRSFTKRAGYQGCICLETQKSAPSSENYITMKVIAKDGLNYRTTYKVSASTLAGTLKYGTKVKVVKGWGWTTNGYTWYKILLNGKYFYCVSKWLRHVS